MTLTPMRRILALSVMALFPLLPAFLGFNLFPAPSALAAPNAARHVTKLADTSDGVCDSDCSLREAIIAASDGDTIDFPSVNGTIPLSLGALAVTKSITISGPGSANLAVSGGNLNRVFEITGSVTISGLTIRDGNAGGADGGAIYLSSNKSLTITNSTIVSNSTSGSGGAIWNVSLGTLVISNTILSGNVSRNGTAIVNQGVLKLQNSSLVSNTSTGGDGAALYNPNAGDLALIVSSSIISNTGIGIMSEGPMTIISSTIAYNSATSATASGAGIYADHPLTITASAIHHNTAGAASGGGIQSTINATMTLNNVTISDNKAMGVNAQGGGLLVGAAANLNNVTIVGNTSENGGGVYVSLGAQLNMRNTILALNTASFSPDCFANGTLNSLDYNLIGDTTNCAVSGTTVHNQSGDPMVTPLAALGGPSRTRGLLAGSPALNNGNPATCLTTDQRGIIRPLPTTCDIGAFEGMAYALDLPLILR